MVSIKNLLFLAASASAAVLPRAGGGQILADLYSLDNDALVLTRDLAKGPLASIAIAIDVNQFLSDLNTTTTDAELATNVVQSDAEAALSYLQNTLARDLELTISTAISERLYFTAAFLEPAVLLLLELKKLRTAFSAFAVAIEGALPTVASEIAQTASAIDSSFARAINAYTL